MLKPMNIHESGPIGRRQQQTSDLCEIIKIVRNLSIKSEILVEAAGVELSGVLRIRKLLIPGTATKAKKAPLPDPLYVYCTKIL